MGKTMKVTGRAESMPIGLGIGTVTSLFITIMSSIMIAKMVDIGKLEWESVGYGILAQTMVSSFMGALIAMGKIKRQRLLVCALSGSIYYGILLLTAMLFFGGQYDGMGVTAAIVLAGCGSAALLGTYEGRGANRRKSKNSVVKLYKKRIT